MRTADSPRVAQPYPVSFITPLRAGGSQEPVISTTFLPARSGGQEQGAGQMEFKERRLDEVEDSGSRNARITSQLRVS